MRTAFISFLTRALPQATEPLDGGTRAAPCQDSCVNIPSQRVSRKFPRCIRCVFAHHENIAKLEHDDTYYQH